MAGSALLLAAVIGAACSDDVTAEGGSTGDEDAQTQTTGDDETTSDTNDDDTNTGDGDGDGDGSGDGDGDASGDGDGDGSGDGDGDGSGDGDGDGSGDGDGDGSGDGDGDGEPECGNGIVEADEQCDDGNPDDTDACTSLCAPPACDDGIVSGDETDVDCGGSCEFCELGALCELGSDCSSAACIMGSCGYATSCAELIELNPGLADGIHDIDPDGPGGAAPYAVACEMSTSGGGWTLILVASDDGADTWTWAGRAALANDASSFGSLDELSHDFKSPAYNQLRMRDLLFVHAPSGVWAQYDDVGDGSQDLGAHIDSVPVPMCDATLGGNGHEMSAGTLDADANLCDTDLYFNVGDHEDGVPNCMAMEGSHWSPATYGPAWNSGYSDGCDFDDPITASLGPQSGCLNCAPDFVERENPGVGFGRPRGLNSGIEGTGENNLRVYVR